MKNWVKSVDTYLRIIQTCYTCECAGCSLNYKKVGGGYGCLIFQFENLDHWAAMGKKSCRNIVEEAYRVFGDIHKEYVDKDCEGCPLLDVRGSECKVARHNAKLFQMKKQYLSKGSYNGEPSLKEPDVPTMLNAEEAARENLKPAVELSEEDMNNISKLFGGKNNE